MLGYFSLIGLCRLHSLLGDFYQAIHILENIDINKKTMYSRVPACQVRLALFRPFPSLISKYLLDVALFSNVLSLQDVQGLKRVAKIASVPLNRIPLVDSH